MYLDFRPPFFNLFYMNMYGEDILSRFAKTLKPTRASKMKRAFCFSQQARNVMSDCSKDAKRDGEEVVKK